MGKAKRGASRKPGSRAAKPTILIVCEGETEWKYFKDIKNRYKAQWMEPKLSNHATPLEIVACGKRMQRALKKKGLDVETWVVFDAERKVDEHPRHYREAIQKAQAAGFKVANSSPCFEYWILLHFDNTANVSEPEKAEAELRRAGRIPGYEKPGLPYETLWQIAKSDGPLMAAQARRDDHASMGNNPRYARPVTYVDELIQRIRTVAAAH